MAVHVWAACAGALQAASDLTGRRHPSPAVLLRPTCWCCAPPRQTSGHAWRPWMLLLTELVLHCTSAATAAVSGCAVAATAKQAVLQLLMGPYTCPYTYTAPEFCCCTPPQSRCVV
jgi:hypothetical protein